MIHVFMYIYKYMYRFIQRMRKRRGAPQAHLPRHLSVTGAGPPLLKRIAFIFLKKWINYMRIPYAECPFCGRDKIVRDDPEK